MATDIANRANTGKKRDTVMTVTKFWGGKDNGQMVQVTQTTFSNGPENTGFVHMDADTARWLAGQLMEWANTSDKGDC